MSDVQIAEIWIDKQNLGQTQLTDHSLALSSLGPNQVLLKVESVGFSANNVTYALLGDRLGYWGFFPAGEGWGKLPLWGFAVVQASNHPDISVGEKVFGYLPSASHLVITADKVTPEGFYDVDEQRKSINSVYDHYVRCASDPGYSADREAWQLNYRPLFMTSFVLDDYTGEIASESTKRVILTSASSKTAYGAAFLLKHHRKNRNLDYKVVGLTSNGNKEFVANSECYDEVISYDELDQVALNGENIVLDFAGNKSLLLQIQERTTEQPARMIFVGVTDVASQADKTEGHVDGEMFFAPAQVKKRTKELGPKGFLQAYGMAWHEFAKHINDLVTIKELNGVENVQKLYLEGLAGKFDTSEILVARF